MSDPQTLAAAVDRSAARAPTDEAVRFAGNALTWAELATRSSQLARVLRDQGVRRGDRVGIHADKGLDAAVALYGIMKAGAAYVPLDPKAPPSRQGFVVRDCGIRHLVTAPARAAALEALLPEVPDLAGVVGWEPDGDTTGPGAREGRPHYVSWGDVITAPEEPGPPPGADDLAYVLYTSGSTGTPKGVVHTHRSALAFARVAAEIYGFRPEDRLSNHAPLHFDLSTMDYFSAALAGATTVVVPEIYTKVPASLAKLIEVERLSVLYMVPLALTHLLLHGALDQRDLSSVRWVLFGGEPFPTRHLRDLMAALPHATFSNVYGPTEVNGVTYWVVPQLPGHSDEPIPIGDVYPGVEPLVLDTQGDPVAEGEAGELLVRTPTMMRGYWNRPDLDARGFWEHPEGRGTYYRTGDLVRARPDGTFDFLGRIDRQIKARGYRIELDEIEAAMMTHDAVAAAAAFGVRESEGSLRVEAAVTPREGQALDADEVRAAVARILPPYMVPERLAVLEAMPRTSSGKIDRIELARRAESASTGRAPGTDRAGGPEAAEPETPGRPPPPTSRESST